MVIICVNAIGETFITHPLYILNMFWLHLLKLLREHSFL